MTFHIEIDEYSDGQQEQLFELFGSFFPPNDRLLGVEYTRWLYASNPYGNARMVRICEGSRWVAFMAMIPVVLVRAGQSQKAYYVVNVLVHPDFHGKGLFARMITAAMENAEADGSALMGHPNDMAIKSWQLARMDFHEALRPSVAIPALAFWRYCASQARTESDLERLRDLLESLSFDSKYWSVRASPEYLSWRFLQHPTNEYLVQVISRSGVYVGLQITKRLRAGVRLLIDQFVSESDRSGATGKLPAITLCFEPTSIEDDFSRNLHLPLKKRIPFFLTQKACRIESSCLTRIGLSASDF